MGRSLWLIGRALCDTPEDWLRLGVVYGALVGRALLGRTTNVRALRLRLRIGGRVRDWWVADPMEIATLWEVFVAREYGDWLPPEASLVVDAGANVGAATAWFREQFPGARVVAIEANPDAVARLRRNVGDDPNVVVVHAALTQNDGTVLFDPGQMTIIGRVVDHGGPKAIPVEAITLSTVCARFANENAVDILKLDIEGSEWQVLANPLSGVRTLVLETHEPVPAGRTAEAILREVAIRDGFELRRGQAKSWAEGGLRWLVRGNGAGIP